MIEIHMDIKGLQFESRFSLPPNSLGYCGEHTAPAKFKRCIIYGDCEGVEEEVTKFIVLHPYLRLVSEISDLHFASHKVIESYWIGNELLKKIKPTHYNVLLDKFLEQGVPDFFVEDLRLKKPKTFIPTHLFQVLHVGVGRASGAVPFNLESINNCMIRWGKIRKIRKHKNEQEQLTIDLISLEQKNHKYSLCETEEIVPNNQELVSNVTIGDTVAVHWNMVIKKLTADEVDKIAYWTKEVVKSI